MERGTSLLETLVVLTIIGILGSSSYNTQTHLRAFKAHKLCSKMEFYLNTLKYLAEHKENEAVFLVLNNKELLGIDAGKVIFRELSYPNFIYAKSGIGSPNSIIFYPRNSTSPAMIEVKDAEQTFCSLSISLRGRIRKFNYDT